MFEALKTKVLEENLQLYKNHLVLYTWGNVSERDEKSGLIAIKPSGVSYEKMKRDDIVIIDINGKIIDGVLNPSSDTQTHLEIYREHPEIHGIAHTHSTYAVAFAQAGKDIPPLGTTHADYFYGQIPCTRSLTKQEILNNYEKNTGLVINETICSKKFDIFAVPAILVRNHGLFTWGKDGNQAVYYATVAEEVAKMAFLTLTLNPNSDVCPRFLMDKHYFRKHGKNAYYGQK
jgi:L-ribulose-5-phosphate 4-epimerase